MKESYSVERWKADCCIFCGFSKTTKEHVFPRWTHKFMPPRINGKVISLCGTIKLSGGSFHERKMKGALRDWQISCVCGGGEFSCNNGWMRKIEEAVKPILTPLIEGRSGHYISGCGQETIATWAIIKSMISECDLGKRPLSLSFDRLHVRSQGSPPPHGWAVWIGRWDQADLRQWSSFPFFVLDDSKQRLVCDQTPPFYNSNVTTQVVGCFVVQVMHCPYRELIESWKYDLPQDRHLSRIWPPRGAPVIWPNRPLTASGRSTLIFQLKKSLRSLARPA